MNFDPAAYNIVVRQACVDGDMMFEARIRELPDVVEYAENAAEAYDLAIDTIEMTQIAFGESGRSMPPPLVPADEFSGRVTLRMPKCLHRSLSDVATDEGVSLNHHIVCILAYYSGFGRAARIGLDHDWQTVPRPAVTQSKSVHRVTQLKAIDHDPVSRYATT